MQEFCLNGVFVSFQENWYYQISVIFFFFFFLGQNQNWTDTWALVRICSLSCQNQFSFARIFNATAICVLSDIFQHFRRNKHRYIDGVLLLLLSHFSHVRPHRRQPTRLFCPWDSPGKNTGVGCHFLLHRWSTGVQSQINKFKTLLFLKIYGKLNVEPEEQMPKFTQGHGFCFVVVALNSIRNSVTFLGSSYHLSF